MSENLESIQKVFSYPPRTPTQRLAWEFLFLMVIIVAVAIFGQLASKDILYTIILTIIFSGNIVIRFRLINEQGDWIFFILGVLGGGGNDLISMINGVYSYTSITIVPFLNGLLPLWMIFFWGQVFLIFRKIFNIEWCRGEPFQKTGFLLKGWVDRKLILDIIVLILLRIAIYRTYMDFILSTAIYGLVIAVRFLIIRPKKNEILIIAILPYAFIFEGLMVTFGLYVYINPVFLGMPLWLFLWWIFLVPLFLKEIFDRIEYYLKSPKL